MSHSAQLDLSPLPLQAPPVLDAQQQAVVEHCSGPLLVLAGPGTGKTTTIVESVAARLTGSQPLLASQVLVLTFGKKAAEEVRNRIMGRLGGGLVPLVATFHSFAYGVVRALATESDPLPRLLSGAEEDARIRELMLGSVQDESITWPDDLGAALSTLGFANEVRAVLARAAAAHLDGAGLQALGHQAGMPAWAAIGMLAQQSDQVADLEIVMDYTELLEQALSRLDTKAGRELASSFAAIYVDEYQDTDPVQVALLSRLVNERTCLVAVGDPDQSIYAFRGADISGILTFPNQFRTTSGEPAPTIALRNARRFGAGISAAGRAVLGTTLHAHLPAEAQQQHRHPRVVQDDPADVPVRMCTFDSSSARASHVARQIRMARVEQDMPWSQMAVLVRTSGQLREMQRALTADGIPVHIASDEIPLAQEPTVAILLQALQAVAHPQRITSSVAGDLLIGPLCGLDPVDVRRLSRSLRQGRRVPGVPGVVPQSAVLLCDLLKSMVTTGPAALLEISATADVIDQLQATAALLHSVFEYLRQHTNSGEALWMLWDGSVRGRSAHHWPARLRRAALAGSRTANHDLDTVIALFDAAERAASLRGGVLGADVFIELLRAQHLAAEQVGERSVPAEAVRVLTAHRAKGLEWDAVWIVGLEDQVWPDLRPRGAVLQADRLGPQGIGPGPSKSQLLSEERRLLYVAVTRARKVVTLTAVAAADIDGQRPSRLFVDLAAQTGIEVEEIPGRPRFGLSLDGLVGQLREVAGSSQDAPLARAAAARLWDLSTQRFADGAAMVPLADPANWWGARERTRGIDPVRDPDRPIALSGSGLDNVLSCPLQWLLSHEVHAQVPTSAKASFGSIVHAVADAIAKGVISDQLQDIDAYIDRVWGQVPFRASWESVAERAELTQAIQAFIALERTNTRALVDTEVHVRGEITVTTEGGFTDTVSLNGYMDRVERDGQDRLVAVDLKTGATAKVQKDAEHDGQLGVYQLLIRSGALGEGQTPGGGQLLYLRDRLSSQLPKERTQAALGDSDEFEGKLAQAAVVIRTEGFDAVLNQRCRTCEYQTCCPLQAGLMSEDGDQE